MKTLIINGSPRKNGDTASLLTELKNYLNHDVIEISVYDEKVKIQPCIDCRACKENKGCIINDDMQLIYEDDFDNVVIASPLYMSNLTPPLMSLASRFQAYYCAKRFLKDEILVKRKKGALILVGGGDGNPENAIELSEWILKKLNAEFENHMTFSLKTDDIPASQDEAAIKGIQSIASFFNTLT